MSRLDPGAASGQQVYTPLARCTCGCLSTLHNLSEATGARTGCSNSNCDCRRFTEAEGDDQ